MEDHFAAGDPDGPAGLPEPPHPSSLPGQAGPAGHEPLWLHPDDDLAPNRPGEHLHARLARIASDRGAGRRPARWEPSRLLGLGRRGRRSTAGTDRAGQPLGPGAVGAGAARGRPAAAATRLIGRPDPVAGWRRQLLGHQRVGERLERLTGGGWRVLHSVPMPGDATIPHLLLGPGGAFTVRPEYRGRARVSVDEDSVRGRRVPLPRPRGRAEPAVDDGSAEAGRAAGRWAGRSRGGAEPSVRWSRREARRASLALSRAAGFPVRVRPVLVVVGASAVRVAPGLRDVLVLCEGAVGDVGGGGALWKPVEVEAVYAVARDRRTWSVV